MNSKYAAATFCVLLITAAILFKFCSTGEAPENFDPTAIEST
jgi:hypothetical protein